MLAYKFTNYIIKNSYELLCLLIFHILSINLFINLLIYTYFTFKKN